LTTNTVDQAGATLPLLIDGFCIRRSGCRIKSGMTRQQATRLSS
jgi:hypothetical protein